MHPCHSPIACHSHCQVVQPSTLPPLLSMHAPVPLAPFHPPSPRPPSCNLTHPHPQVLHPPFLLSHTSHHYLHYQPVSMHTCTLSCPPPYTPWLWWSCSTTSTLTPVTLLNNEHLDWSLCPFTPELALHCSPLLCIWLSVTWRHSLDFASTKLPYHHLVRVMQQWDWRLWECPALYSFLSLADQHLIFVFHAVNHACHPLLTPHGNTLSLTDRNSRGLCSPHVSSSSPWAWQCILSPPFMLFQIITLQLT